MPYRNCPARRRQPHPRNSDPRFRRTDRRRVECPCLLLNRRRGGRTLLPVGRLVRADTGMFARSVGAGVDSSRIDNLESRTRRPATAIANYWRRKLRLRNRRRLVPRREGRLADVHRFSGRGSGEEPMERHRPAGVRLRGTPDLRAPPCSHAFAQSRTTTMPRWSSPQVLARSRSC